MDSIREGNAYLPAWAIRYVQELVREAGYRVDLSDWEIGGERIGYILFYQLDSTGGFYWRYRDWCLCESYAKETLGFNAGMVIREIERIGSMILQQAKTENLKEGDIARYQGRLVLISGDRHEYGELAHSLFDVLYLENGAVDIANWMRLEGVGEITSEELTALMRVFVHHMAIMGAIAKVVAYQAMREVKA